MHSTGFQVSSYKSSKLFEYCTVSLLDGKCYGDLCHVLVYFWYMRPNCKTAHMSALFLQICDNLVHSVMSNYMSSDAKFDVYNVS